MILGNKDEFGFEIILKSIEDHECEIKLFVDGKNICSFKRKDDKFYTTTRWNLDELIGFLYSTLDFISYDEAFPLEIAGECAAELDNNARDFEDEDEHEMETYYNRLNEWSYAHSWHHACSGAILADVFFRKLENGIEVSWWSDQEDDGITFKHSYGYTVVDFETYGKVIQSTVSYYNDLWL